VEAPHGWAEIDGALERTFRFADFAAALAFVNRVGALAEAEGHHPDVAIHWNLVTLRWWTHVEHAITARDRALAALTSKLSEADTRTRPIRPCPGR
jgi:4a-hydroxytetrahydrobiopterin dehydratase